MGARVTIGGSGSLFVGEDKTVRFEVLDTDDVPVNIASWTIAMIVHSKLGDVLLTKSATVSGTHNATRSVNTQRASVTLTDTELQIPPGTHLYSCKRTDDGSEAVLAYGDFIVERTTQT